MRMQGFDEKENEEMWTIKTNIFQNLFLGRQKSPMLALKHSKSSNSIKSNEQIANVVGLSVTVTRFQIQSVNIDPIVGVKDFFTKRLRTFLLGVSFKNLKVGVSAHFQVAKRDDNSIETVTIDGQLLINSIRVNLFSKGLFVLLIKKIESLWGIIRKGKLSFQSDDMGLIFNQSEESESSIVAGSISIDSTHNEVDRNNQSPMYILNKIFGGTIIRGLNIDAKINCNPSTIASIDSKSPDSKCCHISISSKRISFMVNIPSPHHHDHDDSEKIILNLKDLQTFVRVLNTDEDNNVPRNTAQRMCITSLNLLLNMSAGEEGGRIARVEFNSGHSPDIEKENIALVFSGTQMSALLAFCRINWTSFVREFKSLPNGRLSEANTSQRTKTKRFEFQISEISVNINVLIALEDERYRLVSDNNLDSTRVAAEILSSILAQVRFENSRSCFGLDLQLAHTKLIHSTSINDKVIQKTSMFDLEYIIISNKIHAHDSRTEISMGDIFFEAKDETQTRDVVLLITSFLSFLRSTRSMNTENPGNKKYTFFSKDLVMSCSSITVDMALLSVNEEFLPNLPTYYIIRTQEVLMHNTETEISMSSSIKVANINVSLGFSPHATFPTFHSFPLDPEIEDTDDSCISSETRYSLFELKSSDVDILSTKDDEKDSLVFSTADLFVSERMNWIPRKGISGQCNNLIMCNGPLELRTDKERGPQLILEKISFNLHCEELRILWSPIVQWYISSAIKHVHSSIVRPFSTPNQKRPDENVTRDRKVNRRVLIRSNSARVYARFVLGGGSVADLTTVDLFVDIFNDRNDTWDKPNVSVSAGETSLDLNESKFQVAILQSIIFFNGLRRASAAEIDAYCSQRSGAIDLNDEIVVGLCGTPLVERFEITIGGMANVSLPPTVHLGKIIEDINRTQRSTKDGLLYAGLSKETHHKKLRYQLMDISMKIPFLEAHFLEDEIFNLYETADMNMINMVGRLKHGRLATHGYLLDRWRFHITGFDVKIKRHTPPQKTQQHLRDLDEDKSRKYLYGPKVDGGVFSVHFDRVVNTLHPQNLSTPLGDITNWDINGLLYLAALDPITDGLTSGHHFCIPVKCHHTNRFTNGPDEASCGCNYAVRMFSRKIPTKIYFDLELRSDLVHSTYGDIVGRSISNLMNIINRLIPKPPLEDPRLNPECSSTSNPPNLDWWDNLRNQFHGKFKWMVDTMSFRWLLDCTSRYDKCLFLTADKFILTHKTGIATLDLDNVIISVPDSSYHMLNGNTFGDGASSIRQYLLKSDISLEMKRHPLILFPHLSIQFKFKWDVSNVESTRHHSSYTEKDVNDCVDDDYFHRFRSHGWHIHLSVFLQHENEYENWIALRGDVLPWLTHKSTVYRSPGDTEQSNDGPDPLPKLRSIQVIVDTSNLNIGAWFEEVSTSNHSIHSIEKIEGLYFHIPNLSYTLSKTDGHVIDLSKVRAALLTVDTGRSDQRIFLAQAVDSCKKFELLLFPEILYEINAKHTHCLFDRLQQATKNVKSLEYLLFVDRVKILDRSLQDIKSSQFFAYKNGAQWSVLVARMKLLWTVVIRDSVLAIVKDILFAINFMSVNSRGTPQLLEVEENIKSTTVAKHEGNFVISDGGTSADDSSSDSDSKSSINVAPKSHLNFLLDDNEDDHVVSGSNFIAKANNMTHTQDNRKQTMFRRGATNTIVPTFNLHLSNPQIQFHSEKTGGSIIIGLRGAYIEARKFMNLFAKEEFFEKDDFRLETLLRRTEFAYTLDRLELFSINDNVDVDVGLQWLEVDLNGKSESFADSEYQQHQRFLGNGRYCSSSEEFGIFDIKDFSLPFLCSSIMSPATFKTIQRFHRPPIDLTKEELEKVITDRFISSFESANNDDAQGKSIDFLQIMIDELAFYLDSYQFSTTLDVIRNTLLEPLKPRKERYYQQRKKSDDQSSLHRDRSSPMRSGFISQNTAQSRVEQALLKWQTEPNSKAKKKWREHLRVLAKYLLVEIEERQHSVDEPSIRQIEYSLGKAKWTVAGPDSTSDAEIIFTGFKGVHDFTADGSVNSQIGLEDMHVRALNPTSQAMIFHDSSVILKTILGNERSPCQRCGEYFERSSNHAAACTFHPGVYEESQNKNIYRWSCCDETDQFAAGCEARPHTGLERAIQVRFDALPRKVKGLSMYRHFEANIYPGVPHTIVVQLTKSHAKSFMDYFLGNSSDILDNDDESMISEPIGSRERLESFGDENRRLLLFGGTSSKKDFLRSKDSKDSELDNEKIKSRGKKELGEIIFLKLWRMGDININLSIAGFGRVVDINEQALVVSSFQRAYKIGPVDHLVRKVLGHLLKDLMSSGLEIIKDKLSGKNKYLSNNTQQKQLKGSALEAVKEEGSDDEHRNELLLGATDLTKKNKKLIWFRRKQSTFHS